MPGTLKLVSLRLINEKSPLFNLYSSSLWVFVPWWLNSYFCFSFPRPFSPSVEYLHIPGLFFITGNQQRATTNYWHYLTGCCPNGNPFERSLKRFCQQILAKWKISDVNCLSPKGEFWHRLKRALDLSKNVLDPVKMDFGNSVLNIKLHNLHIIIYHWN